jgi:predicted RNase H-like HicB family nuclease
MISVLTVDIVQENDGRWLAEVRELPGVLARGETQQNVTARVQALALRVLADHLEHQEYQVAEPGLVSVSFQTTTPHPTPRYLEPTQQSGRALVMRQIPGNVVMLNLLRFREIADYSATPELAPNTPISGAAAFQRYIEHTLPYLRETGGDLLFLGAGGAFLIGPQAERWDMVMLVRQDSVESFLAFASHQAYLAGMGHRTAALEDSRLLPLSEIVRETS